MSGGSRGIGLAIAVAATRSGANIALLAKSATPHPRLPGTVYTAAAEIEAAGGRALPVVGDVRDEDTVARFVRQATETFGGVDVVVNNASAINLSPVGALTPKQYDLMMDVNLRGTYLLTRAALPHLRESAHAHVLTLSPPLTTDARWLARHAPYTVTKLGMTMLTLGVAADEPGVGANCLWPRTLIATAAVANLLGGEQALARARTPAIMADAACVILEQPPTTTGNTFLDDEVLTGDLDRYRAGTDDLALDLFVDAWPLVVRARRTGARVDQRLDRRRREGQGGVDQEPVERQDGRSDVGPPLSPSAEEVERAWKVHAADMRHRPEQGDLLGRDAIEVDGPRHAVDSDGDDTATRSHQRDGRIERALGPGHLVHDVEGLPRAPVNSSGSASTVSVAPSARAISRRLGSRS